jgi:AcrR family transcriptional regulator
MNSAGGTGRTNQKTRTRTAIIDACRKLIQGGADVTMLEVAKAALVSEATIYRYFPDFVSLVNEALVGLWPSPAEGLAPIAATIDPVERIAFTTEAFLRRVLAYQGSVRAMISATITRPDAHATRPGFRFTWIDYALAPLQATGVDAQTLAHLKQDLALVISAEALFTLTDLCALTPDDAIAGAVRAATTLTAAALAGGSAARREEVAEIR